ncbi:MAG TPA: SUMF1/EgtB/PvdO family nonheme iron enzyme [Planctomycetaceae bacterium]|nr:SUMF1/EgtB/PvdO family nonheme iron enzyme [Planctomycetaceae bacterium]
MNEQSRRAEPNDPQVAAALRDYLERVDRGDPVDREEFLARHAPIADQLRSFIAAEDEVRNLAEAATPLDQARDSTKSFVAQGQETLAPQTVAMGNVESDGGGLSGQFGRYRIIRALGKGAMGTVYLAEDTQLERSVAIKTPHFSESPSAESLERFYREARVAATLRQPNICPVFDVGQIDGKHYISMAYIEGRPLSAFIKPDKPQTERQILIVIRKLALALQEAHDHGIVHRDLKPANIMVDKKGEPIIMDFGLAQQAPREGDIRLTQTGNVMGTPAYMSPEQVEGEPDKIGPPTDQYSLGVILYELLTAQLPFRGSVIAVMGQILTKEPTPPSQSRPDLDPRIEAVCLKMLSKTPSGRFASLKAVAEELATILKSPVAKPDSKEQSAAAQTGSSSDRLRSDAGASPDLKSLKPKALLERDPTSPEELTPIGVLDQFRRPINEGGWIPWSVLAFGLVAFAVLTGVIVIHLNKTTAVLVDIQDPGVEVALKGSTLTVTGPDQQSVKVDPGDQELTITSAGLETITKSFSLKKGDKKTVTVSIVDSELVARLENEIAPLTPAHQDQTAVTLPPVLKAQAKLPSTFKNNLGMEFVLVPKGKSWLGGGGGSTGEREVVIVNDFYLGKYEVTQEEWEKVTRTTPSAFSRSGGGKDLVKDIADAALGRFPVESVSWDDAQVFLESLNKQEKDAGWVYRLPNEAEWEYACRGGPLADTSESAYDFYLDKPTNELLPAQANIDKSLQRTCKVGSYQPNRLGLYDMHGNVWEWCDNVEKTANGTSGREPRGGGWSTLPVACKAANRFGPARWEGRVGLRVARVPVGKEIVKIPPEGKKSSADAAAPAASAIGPPANITTVPKTFGRPFLVRGEWTVENDELVQASLAMGEESCPLLVFGEPTLSNYDLTLEAKKTGGRDQLGIYFHWLGFGHYRRFNLDGNGGIDFSYFYNGKWGREDGNWKGLSFSSNRWYSLKFETRGDTFRAYVDGALQFEQTDARFAHGRICLYTWNAAARFRRIKISDPQGKVLFEGLPELPASGQKPVPIPTSKIALPR